MRGFYTPKTYLQGEITITSISNGHFAPTVERLVQIVIYLMLNLKKKDLLKYHWDCLGF